MEAADFLQHMKSEVQGFCKNSVLKPTKQNGYIQLSEGGGNKFCTLGEMVAWAKGAKIRLGSDDQVSHLCHNPKCMVLAHITIESVLKNNNRKGCLVWIDCPHGNCDKKIIVCNHSPDLCIKYCSKYNSWAEFLLNKRQSAFCPPDPALATPLRIK